LIQGKIKPEQLIGRNFSKEKDKTPDKFVFSRRLSTRFGEKKNDEIVTDLDFYKIKNISNNESFTFRG